MRESTTSRWCAAAGICLLLSLPVTARAQAADGASREERWSSALGLDLGSFGSRESLITLGLAGAFSAWTWEETDERQGAICSALDKSSVDFLMDAGNIYGDGRVVGGAAVAAMGIGRAVGSDGCSAFGADLARSFAYTAIATSSVKLAVGRKRPAGGSYSFPSGHTASAFSTVPVIWHHAGWQAGLGAGVMAAATALGRLEENRHFASDVIAGAAFGFVVGRAVVRQRKLRGSPDSVSVTARSVALAWRF